MCALGDFCSIVHRGMLIDPSSDAAALRDAGGWLSRL